MGVSRFVSKTEGPAAVRSESAVAAVIREAQRRKNDGLSGAVRPVPAPPARRPRGAAESAT